jgi:hypothetical protein
MGTRDEGGETLATPITMDDFKTLESYMATQLGEMGEMIAQLMQASKVPTPHPVEFSASLNKENVGYEDEHAKKDKNKDANSYNKDNMKCEFHQVPCYSPDPPVTHPHIKIEVIHLS